VANPDYPYGAFAKSTIVPAVLAKATRRTDEAKAQRDVYAEVDARDGKKCKATGRPLFAGAIDPRMRLERHHIKKRSTDKALRYVASNIVTLAGDVHQLVEAKALLIEGTNANKRLVFHWNREMVPVGKEPFKLLSKRKSQNKE
jgi:hypothetical protein